MLNDIKFKHTCTVDWLKTSKAAGTNDCCFSNDDFFICLTNSYCFTSADETVITVWLHAKTIQTIFSQKEQKKIEASPVSIEY